MSDTAPQEAVVPAAQHLFYNFAAVLLVLASICLSWLVMWRVVLSKISFVRTLFDLPEQSPQPNASRRKPSQKRA